MIYDTVIVGGGMAGLSAAIYLRRAEKTVLLVENAAYGGQILTTERVENYPGFEAISGADLAERVRIQAQKLGAEFLYAEVLGLEQGEVKTVRTDEGSLQARTVILATGSKVRKLGAVGEAEFEGRGVSYCATCDGAFYKGKNVMVVGGGNTALYEALYLAGMARKVYLVNKRGEFRGEAAMVDELERRENVEIWRNSDVVELVGSAGGEANGDIGDEKGISGTRSGRVLTGVKVRRADGVEGDLDVEGVFVAVGRRPDMERFADVVNLDEVGYVLAGEDCKTSAGGVFAIGDCRQKGVRQLVTAAGDAAVAASGVVEFLKV